MQFKATEIYTIKAYRVITPIDVIAIENILRVSEGLPVTVEILLQESGYPIIADYKYAEEGEIWEIRLMEGKGQQLEGKFIDASTAYRGSELLDQNWGIHREALIFHLKRRIERFIVPNAQRTVRKIQEKSVPEIAELANARYELSKIDKGL